MKNLIHSSLNFYFCDEICLITFEHLSLKNVVTDMGISL